MRPAEIAELAQLSISELGERMTAGTLSAETLVEACLSAIANRNPSLNAFITVFGDAARQQARTLDGELHAGRPRGPLHGMPISIKDLIDVEGAPTTAASRVRAADVARRDATVVVRLRRAGAVIVGKCNLHEFALGTTSDESAFGPCRHPFDPARSPGGSSGGSAIAVATGMSIASIGTDTGGSIRIPAAACGVVGLKPAFAEIPMAGILPLARSLDHVGPLTRCVRDAWLIHDVLQGRRFSPHRDRSIAGIRLAIPTGYFLERLDADVREQFQEAVARLRSAGTTVEETTIPHCADAPAIYLHIALPEAAAYHATSLERTPEAYSEGVRLRLEMGRYVLAEDYVRAQQGRSKLRAEIDAALDTHDALVLPTLAIPAPYIGATSVGLDSTDEALRPLMLRLTQLFNLTGHPAISLPCGRTTQGFPCGLQLVGRHAETTDLLRIALACEPYVTLPGFRLASGR